MSLMTPASDNMYVDVEVISFSKWILKIQMFIRLLSPTPVLGLLVVLPHPAQFLGKNENETAWRQIIF
jgi:hypothetical protein